MTVRARDRDRAAVYAAELAAFDGTSYESEVGLDALVAIARRLTSADWWTGGDVLVRASRADARSSVTRKRGSGPLEIRLAAPQCTVATVLHELAHALAGPAAGHGPTFRRAFVDLVAVELGGREAGWLGDAFAAFDLALGERAWPEPPVAGTAIAL